MKQLAEQLNTIRTIAVCLAVIAVVAAGIWIIRSLRGSRLNVESSDAIGLTPTQIESIRAIGEWEFLSVTDEELVDTTRKGLLSDDHLVRIYYGTLRIGVNMRQTKPHWLTVSGDTARAILPRVGLLDRDFIDEARTQSFFESGKWKATDREALYKRAYRQMKAHCLTPQNLQAARTNGEAQMTNLLRAMGYRHIIVSFEN